MYEGQTLREALEAEHATKSGTESAAFRDTGGAENQINLLTEEAQNLTKERLEKVLSNEEKLPEESMLSLRNLALARLKNGQPVVPWTRLEGLRLPENNNVVLFGW